jgi:hypothetical protein
MGYVKGILSGLVAIILAELVPGYWSVFRGISGTKATGLGALKYSLLESLFSPLFWILAISFFALFFSASRSRNKPIRVLVFWIPTVTVTTISSALVALFTYLIVHGTQQVSFH